jgi:acetyl-CoA carboxylase carboxyl transferase subunit alpha
MAQVLDFEKPILELESKISELKNLSQSGPVNLQSEIKKLEGKLIEVKEHTYSRLTPWQRVQIARHPRRPYTLDYISMLFTDFEEIYGDRAFADDKALITGFGLMDGQRFCVMGHQKGRDAKENIFRNFGSAHPEGYRKAMRVMKLAEKFGLPVICLIDTPGAYPGVGAEERGQANMIAFNLREMSELRVPTIGFVIGEGGSGGALGIGVTDRMFVLENAYYSVISPEGCAAILWKDHKKAPDAAAALKLTAKDLLQLGIIDGIVREPLGGAHFDPQATAQEIKKTIFKTLPELLEKNEVQLVAERYDKYRGMGQVAER